uniref:Uncharacterized protein n=1 Tax=Lactuca sativa TaxID=4236 RepID=A0A9R1W6S2_LACSA|nr:hypothetical protein LSAT_V11C300113590 [Lactuca sativa]
MMDPIHQCQFALVVISFSLQVNATLNATGRAPFTEGVGLESVIKNQSHISASNNIQQIDNLQSSLKAKSVEILHVDLVLLSVYHGFRSTAFTRFSIVLHPLIFSSFFLLG